MNVKTRFVAALTFGIDGKEICGDTYATWDSAMKFIRREIEKSEYAWNGVFDITCNSSNAPAEIRYAIDFGNKFFFARIVEKQVAEGENYDGK